MTAPVTVDLHGRSGIVGAATVDAADFGLVARYRWNLTSHGYVVTSIPHPDGGKRNYTGRKAAGNRRTLLQMHRLIFGLETGDATVVDHVNHDLTDNRRVNLRPGTPALNRQNVRPYRNSVSGIRGVFWDARRGMWRAQASLSGQDHFLGHFATSADAEAAASAWRSANMPFAVETATGVRP